MQGRRLRLLTNAIGQLCRADARRNYHLQRSSVATLTGFSTVENLVRSTRMGRATGPVDNAREQRAGPAVKNQ